MPVLRMEAVVRTERNAALTAAADAIGRCGGWIDGHRLFSDVMAVLSFAVPADRTGDLGRELAAAGIAVSPVPPETLGAPEQEVPGQLTLTFTGGTGDLRRAVPAFP